MTKKIETDALCDMLDKLIGDIDPVGETRADEQHLENLKQLGDVFMYIRHRLTQVSRNNTDYRHSVKEIGIKAHGILVSTAYELRENGIGVKND